jgi:hypothetical protein
MKYYIGKIDELNGEFSYDSVYLFVTDKSPKEYTQKTAMEWRGGDESDYDDSNTGYEGYRSDHTMIFDRGSTEVSREDFQVLEKYLTIL